MLSDSRFAQVIYNLRVADAYYYAEARYRRAAYRPTSHAKRRALQIDLKVNTDKAARMSSVEAYAVRYPQVVQTYSPVADSNDFVSTTGWVAGPTANDLLKMNATLTKFLARPTPHVVDGDGTCGRRMYPSLTYDVPRGHRSVRVHPSATLTHSNIVSPHSLAFRTADTTPPEDVSAPLKIRINFKRKFLGDDNHHYNVKKRPRYGRKHWVVMLKHDLH